MSWLWKSSIILILYLKRRSFSQTAWKILSENVICWSKQLHTQFSILCLWPFKQLLEKFSVKPLAVKRLQKSHRLRWLQLTFLVVDHNVGFKSCYYSFLKELGQDFTLILFTEASIEPGYFLMELCRLRGVPCSEEPVTRRSTFLYQFFFFRFLLYTERTFGSSATLICKGCLPSL